MTDKVKKLLFIAFPSGEGGPSKTVDEESIISANLISSSVTYGDTFSAGEGFFASP